MSVSDLPKSSPLPVRTIERPPVNWRSVLLGLLAVIFICVLTPYNDYVVGNTFFVGNFLPIGLVLFFFVFLIAINAPLWKIAPRLAFTGGELAVVLGMGLVGCSLPSSGLMRYLTPDPVGQRHAADSNFQIATVLKEADLPSWMYPKPHDVRWVQTDSGKWVSVDVDTVNGYWDRVPLPAHVPDTFWNHVRLVPWRAWLRFSWVWGILTAAILGAAYCMTTIVRRQWVQNERLPFPLASVYVSLIETPEPGKAFNPLFRSSMFWIAFALVFVIHGFNGMHAYFPKVPNIPINYKMDDIFSEEPWKQMHFFVKAATLYFSIVGITYFLQSSVAFSLWFFVILWEAANLGYHISGTDFPWSSQPDQFLGGLVPYVIGILWLGRVHWLLVLKQMFRSARSNEPTERYLPYPIAGWGFVCCVAVAGLWLHLAGMTLTGIIVALLYLFFALVFMVRVVAETGLIFVQTNTSMSRPWIFGLNYLPRAISRTSVKNMLLTNWFGVVYAHDLRENFAVFASHAQRVADLEAYDKPRPVRRAIPFTVAILLSLVIGYFVSGSSTLYCNYTYGTPLGHNASPPVNPYGLRDSVTTQVVGATVDYRAPGVGDSRGGPQEDHSRLGWFAFGAIFTTFLMVMRVFFVGWPLHPIGYLLVYSFPMWLIWPSIFVGWLLKVLIVRFGGSNLYRQAKPFFIGLIFGEAGAAAFWLIFSLVRLGMGLEYHSINLLPT